MTALEVIGLFTLLYLAGSLSMQIVDLLRRLFTPLIREIRLAHRRNP